MIWIGPTPSVILNDPRLVREVLSNKFGHFKKQELPPTFLKLIGLGLVGHEGEKWAVHRKIINRAFLLEKLKVTSYSIAIISYFLYPYSEAQKWVALFI